MKIRVLFVQDKESYPCQHAPYAVCCSDEFSDEGNRNMFDEEVEKRLEEMKDDIAGYFIASFEVDQDGIRKLCLETDRKIDVEMVSE